MHGVATARHRDGVAVHGGSQDTSGRAGRAARRLALGAAGAGTARATRAGVERSVPVLRRADEQLGVRVRSAATAGRRQAARAWDVVAADIHAHREAIRSSSPRAGEAVRPQLPGKPGERRPAVAAAGTSAAPRSSLIRRAVPARATDACAWIPVMATVLTMSVTVQPRLRSFTGLRRPCSTGPIATAPDERCTAL